MAFSFFRKKETPQESPDFATITSQEKAAALYRSGILARMYLFPIAFGGQESEANVLYVPPVIVELKDRFDALVADLLEEGKVSSYSASPEYRGDSFIPCKIKLTASGEASLSEEIVIW